MVQFNLLPDVKLQFVKARRTKHLVLLGSLAVSAVSIFLLLLLLISVEVVQKHTMNGLTTDLKSNTKQLTSVQDLNQILTVQNQLNTLTDLHDQKVVTSRLFTYIGQLTPTAASISNLSVDFTQNTLTVTGEAPTLDVINTYVDTLKATTYKSPDDGSNIKAFSAVVLSAFGRDDKGATYTITLNFDAPIFNSANNVTLSVPSGPIGAQTQLFQKQAGN